MWRPDDVHDWGVIDDSKEYHGIISEFEVESDFGNITVSPLLPGEEFETIEAKKTHTQIQVALVEIGRALNFRTWIAGGDRSFTVGSTTLGNLEGVIQSLDEVSILYTSKIKDAARLIDCIWFTSDGNVIPAVIEVEHSTGITSGLTRMLKFKETIPAISTTFTIVAPDKLRNKAVSEANQKAFRRLDARFMSYSTVRVLYGLIQKYSLSKYVDYNFVYPFMEKVVDS
jgi:type II restriction enzyme